MNVGGGGVSLCQSLRVCVKVNKTEEEVEEEEKMKRRSSPSIVLNKLMITITISIL